MKTEDESLGRCILALIGYLLAAMLLGCPTNLTDTNEDTQ